jgi:hypothetical protein
VGKCGLNPSSSGEGPVAGPYKHGNESLGSIKGGEFLDHMSDYKLSGRTLPYGVSK